MAKKKDIKSAFDKWITRLGLRWWRITIRYYDDPSEIIERFRTDDNFLVLAKTYTTWYYLEATIDINLPAWKEVAPESVERTVIHELIHILVNEMREDDITHEERVVSTLTDAILWTVDAEQIPSQDIGCFKFDCTIERSEHESSAGSSADGIRQSCNNTSPAHLHPIPAHDEAGRATALFSGRAGG